MSKKNLIVGQSGGPTAVINSSLYGVVSEGLRHPGKPTPAAPCPPIAGQGRWACCS